jgi:Ca2+-binding RTX toxin-like protein
MSDIIDNTDNQIQLLDEMTVIDGLDGNDSMFGGAGNDELNGGSGVDQLYGGEGADTFVFRPGDGAGRDVIRDFEDGLDRINLANFVDAQDITDANFASMVTWVQDSASQYTVSLNNCSGTYFTVKSASAFTLDMDDFLIN